MMLRRYGLSALALFALGAVPAHAAPRWSVDLEAGAALTGYNDVAIPGDTGTRFSLSDDLDADPAAFWRLRVSRSLGERHHLSLLVAPLRIASTGQFDRTVRFADGDFPALTSVRARYRFDSYRLTWRWDFARGRRWTASTGLTAKIRDAVIRLTTDAVTAEKANTGFVPLVHLRVDWRFRDRMGLLLEGDGLAAPQGRAEDFLLALYGRIGRDFDLKCGYRILEGGADNDEVYTFALVHYLSIGLTWRL